jgi:LysR family transcriptional activator of nhaA
VSLTRALNLNHLYYFWVAARCGGIAAAGRELHLSQPTLSTQIKTLERALGQRLFSRAGRRLVLTAAGETAFRHADEMFRIGDSLIRSLRGGAAPHLVVGVSEAVPKLVARSVLERLRDLKPPATITCREWRCDQLLTELSLHRLDLAITESPAPPSLSHPTISRSLGESPIGLYAARALARQYRPGFPRSLAGAPFVLPSRGSVLRQSLQAWFDARDIRPAIAAEAEDRAMLNYLGQAGFGIMPAATIIEPEIIRQFEVELVGRADGVRDHYFAVAAEDRLKSPAIAALFAA